MRECIHIFPHKNVQNLFSSSPTEKSLYSMADVMPLHCHIWLVLLLASIASQSGATEYYVKPTDFTNGTCPGQPCLTINEYTNDVTYYIKSNTVLTFLPGKHALVRPIVISNVENISLAAFSNERPPKIVAWFICQEVVNPNCINGPELRLAHTDDFISWKGFSMLFSD